MVVQNDEECKNLIEKLDKGLPPQIIHEIITYLEKTKNTEFIITLVKYLNNQNIQARNSIWALSSQIAMIGEDVGKIKQHLGIQKIILLKTEILVTPIYFDRAIMNNFFTK